MAFTAKPSDWIVDYSADSQEIALPLASLPEVSVAEAAADTGDIRKVVYGLCVVLEEKFASIPLADRPTRMTITKTQGVLQGTRVAVGFQFNFVLETAGLEVADEA